MPERPTDIDDTPIDDPEQQPAALRAIPGREPPPDPEPVTSLKYDIEKINRFLETVFHSELADDERVLTWLAGKGPPGFPITPGALETKLRRQSVPKALYVGTSTVTPHPDDGKLYNRYDQFARLHFAVLDDVGTKIAIDSLPEKLREPSYIIETSPGNFQYGFVLAEPLDDLDQAKALIQLLYDSGYTDGGGAMPTKLVRLPHGINNKPGPRGQFVVKLHRLTNDRWTPEELLDAVGSDVKWADVLARGPAVQRRPTAKNVSPWSPVTPVSPNLDGVADPALEWLYEQGLVAQDTGEWVTIKCPQCDLHTTGDDYAGYSPLGRGEGQYLTQRGFHCFHDHCRTFKTSEFLAWMSNQDGPALPVSDTSTDLMREWVFDPTIDSAIQLYGDRRYGSSAIKIGPLKRMRARSHTVTLADGKLVRVNEVDHWLRSPNCVSVAGWMYDPSTSAPLSTYEGATYLNRFRRPEWGSGEIFLDDEEKFLGFVSYLIPNEVERNYVLDWLALKMQDMTFRGAGLVMVTPTQGTGRNTFGEILSMLYGKPNVTEISFDMLIGRSEFNAWRLSPLIICPETLDLGETSTYRAYERLKSLIEFQPTEVVINEKYGPQRVLPVYSSTILFSNHVNAITAAENDRRLYVVRNPIEPAPIEFFAELREWMAERNPDGTPSWAPSVGRLLLERKVDRSAMMKPPPPTEGKIEMVEATRTPLDRAVLSILDSWHGRFISTNAVKHIVEQMPHRLGIDGARQLSAMLRRVLDKHTTTLGTYRPRAHGFENPTKARFIHGRVSASEVETLTRGGLTAVDIADEMNRNNLDDITKKVFAALDLEAM